MNFLDKFKSRIKLNIKGKNIERFIKRLILNKIEMINISYPSRNQANIIVYKKDYEKILKLKSIYEVNEVDVYGLIRINKVLNLYKYLLLSIIISISLIIFLSNVIFNVEVIHTDSSIRTLLINELESYGITKYKFKKSFKEIQQIKSQILEKYKDKIEWLEIEESGTTYIVRIEERLIINNEVSNTPQNVIAKKSGVIKKIYASSGQVLKELNTYVNKGDVVISGNIYLNDILKDVVKADGKIYAEVWYNVNVEYPYIYSEIKYTGNIKKVYALKIFDNVFEFTKNKYKEKSIEENIILSNSFIPISFVKQIQKEKVTISSVLTEEEAVNKALELSNNKMSEKLKDDECILESKIIKKTIKEDKVILDVFFTVLENITDYEEIDDISQ